MHAPTVSVVVPTWQRRDLVREAIDSVLGQTYADRELIVVDDGSTDGTAEALAPLARDGRVRVVRLEQNRGPSAARNAGVAVARGRLLAFLDSDDLWLPDHLEVATAALERHPRAVLATTMPGRLAVGREGAADAQLVEPLPWLLAENLGWLHCVLVRREPLEAIGGFDERIRAGEHHDLYMRLALRGPFAVLRRRTATRRPAPNSLHETARTDGDYVHGFETTARSVLAAVETEGRNGEVLTGARARVTIAEALRALRDGDRPTASAAIRGAVAAYPRLSSEPEWIAGRLRHISGRAAHADRLETLETAIAAWPHPHSDTALYLRGLAVGVALRSGRPGAAAAAARGWSPAATPGFLRRRAPLLLRRARQSLYRERHRVRR